MEGAHLLAKDGPLPFRFEVGPESGTAAAPDLFGEIGVHLLQGLLVEMTKGVIRQAALEAFEEVCRVFKDPVHLLDRRAALGELLDCRLSEPGNLRSGPGIAEGRTPGDTPILRPSEVQEL